MLAKKRRVVASTQTDVGGALHAVSVVVYVHCALPLALEHVPGPLYVRRVVPLAHVAPGGALHVTPVHGSPAHAVAFALHPNVHDVCAPAWHAPFAHVLAAVAMPPVQLAAAHAVVVGA